MTGTTRAAGLARLEPFAPRMGRFYAESRNTDLSAEAGQTTSLLSPFLRRRLVLESEAVAAAQSANIAPAAEKFIQEIFWRTYFKGHLETRPWIWTDCEQAVRTGVQRLATDPPLARRHEQAITGATGIEGFDAWAQALVRDGWLHNHARMWFASIWIFTLGLPWALGADFFMRHLVDGDPASNTLSWRWVAGLHTRGKPYVARAENIRRFTNGRFSPHGLNETPDPLHEPAPPAAITLPATAAPPRGEVALLLHLDDLHPESLDLGCAKVVRIAGVAAHARDASPMVRQADATAMQDALARAAAHFGCDAIEASAGWAAGWADGRPVIAAWAPVGPSAGQLPPDTHRVRRPWDTVAWPAATRGFFQMKDAIPSVLRGVGLG